MYKLKEFNMNYLSNKEIVPELVKLRESGVVSEKLGGIFISIATNLSNKANFTGYTWKDEMIGEAIYTCIKYGKNFNPEKSNNGFAYITQICYNSFINYIKKQNRHSEVKQCLYDKNELLDDE
jgi:hypothetical protein